jgi:hypothetical protein
MQQPDSKGASTDAPEADEEQFSGESTRDEPTQSRLFELLSNQRRRYALHYLKQNGGSVELGDLAEQVAAWENHKAVDDVTSTERKSVYSSLQQFHLPKLDDEGMVEFDSRAGTVRIGPAVRGVDIYMEVVETGEVAWSQYYLALAGMGCLLMAAGIYEVSVLSGTTSGIVVVTALAVSAVFHTYYSRTEMRLGTGERPPDREEP